MKKVSEKANRKSPEVSQGYIFSDVSLLSPQLNGITSLISIRSFDASTDIIRRAVFA